MTRCCPGRWSSGGVEVIGGGGAAGDGSDAMAGVVNDIRKGDCDGLEIDGQQSISTYGDDYRPYLRLTAGKNFADNRGNIAINLEYSKTDPLLDYDRPWTDLSPIAVTNPNDTGPNDGQPKIGRASCRERVCQYV